MQSLATCSFQDYRPKMGRPVRISLVSPRWRCAASDATALPDLAPHPSYFRAPPAVFTQRYLAQLDRVGVARLWEQFQALADGRPLVLLCFERDAADCHRKLFAEWWLELTDEVIPELGQEV
jgi:hypothetical protein